MVKVYGIRNCDTVKKALRALEAAGHAPELVDIRATPLQEAEIARFFEAFGETLVNRRSTTWRELAEDERGESPVRLISAHPTLMKRPVIETAGRGGRYWRTRRGPRRYYPTDCCTFAAATASSVCG